jgi:hypothetical protein
VETYSRLHTPHVCVKKGIARTKVVRKEGEKVCRFVTESDANARVSGRGGDG